MDQTVHHSYKIVDKIIAYGRLIWLFAKALDIGRLSPPTSTANKPVSSWRTHNWRSYMSNDRPINQTAQFPDDTYNNHGTHINLCMWP